MSESGRHVLDEFHRVSEYCAANGLGEDAKKRLFLAVKENEGRQQEIWCQLQRQRKEEKRWKESGEGEFSHAVHAYCDEHLQAYDASGAGECCFCHWEAEEKELDVLVDPATEVSP